jgi:hypothetical protein
VLSYGSPLIVVRPGLWPASGCRPPQVVMVSRPATWPAVSGDRKRSRQEAEATALPHCVKTGKSPRFSPEATCSVLPSQHRDYVPAPALQRSERCTERLGPPKGVKPSTVDFSDFSASQPFQWFQHRSPILDVPGLPTGHHCHPLLLPLPDRQHPPGPAPEHLREVELPRRRRNHLVFARPRRAERVRVLIRPRG